MADRYLARWQAWLAATEMKTYESVYGPVVPAATLCEPGADLRVLGIGSGSGDVDSVILKSLLQRHNSVYSRVVEPSKQMIDKYKSLVREDTSLGTVEFDWRQQTAEEYFQKKDDTKFHLIHAIHSLYYVEDHDATLWAMWEQLAVGGYMLVIMESDKSDWGKLQYKMWAEFGQGDRLKTPFRLSCDVKKWLEARGIDYVTSGDEININVTECFKEGSKAGRLILDFLTTTPDVSAYPEIKSMALEHIRCNSSVIDEQMIFKGIDEVIAFRKK
uniref:Histamine N-methyltransferase n=1 Tax=Branchiostoma floridae TaxID=7739 RepID=C3YZ68_BRAFL|eukprot:XP_002598564.1 hypothetical protein BRAFLDRAFT_66955 [Branchiostoma floridae]